jgi:glycosyltransferase involved in cell wall biosynthesis
VLPSLAAQDFPRDEYEILLSDSGSTDGTKELIEKLGIPNLRFIQGENRGPSGARNRGIIDARGEIILFTDADIIAGPGLISQHLKTHGESPGCAVVGCEVQVDSLEEYEMVKGRREAFRTLHPPGRRRLSWLYFLTGNASVEKNRLVDAGMFDEDFQGYGHEDLELGYRLEKAGVPILHNSQAVNYHWHPVGYEENCERRRLAGISTVRFFRKHGDPIIRLRLGWNPFNFFWHSLLTAVPPFREWVREGGRQPGFLREMAYQYFWTDGIKEAVRSQP